MSLSIILRQLRNAQRRPEKFTSNSKPHLHQRCLHSNQSLPSLFTTSLAQTLLFLRVTSNKVRRRKMRTATTREKREHCQYHLDRRRKRRYSRRFRRAIYLLWIRIRIQTKNTIPSHLSKRFVRTNEGNELVRQSGRKSTVVRLDISILSRKKKNLRDPRNRERGVEKTRVMMRKRVRWRWTRKWSRKEMIPILRG